MDILGATLASLRVELYAVAYLRPQAQVRCLRTAAPIPSAEGGEANTPF